MLRWMDGFDHEANTTDVINKWGAGAGLAGLVTGRNGGKAISVASTYSYVKKTLDNQQYWYVGFAINRQSTSQGTVLVTFWDCANEQISVGFKNDSTSKLAFLTGGVSPKTSTGGETAIAVSTWYYVEVKIKITSSVASGDCSIYLNGSLYTSLATGQSSRNGSSNNYASAISLGEDFNFSVYGTYFDDFYTCDGQGSTNNGLLGPCYVSTLYPNGAGASTQWTGHSGSNYANVNETQENGDTSYNTTSGVGNRDSYTTGGLTDNPLQIFGVQSVSMNRIDAGETTRTVNNSIKSGSSYSDGAASGNLTSTYSWLTNLNATDPNTSAAWTKTGLNAAEAGIKLVS